MYAYSPSKREYCILIHFTIINASVKPVKRFHPRFRKGFKKIMRIDKFLKVSRILKRRTLSKQACEKGKVVVNGKEVKPAYTVKVGDEVELQFTGGAVKFRVLAIKETVKKDEAQSLYEVIREE